jgi:hypothetical protein
MPKFSMTRSPENASRGMKWYRTYAESLEITLACGRAIVYDPQHCEPAYLSEYSYWPLFSSATDNFCVVEWDIALSAEDRKTFEAHIKNAPDRIHVAPYRSYHYRNTHHSFDWMHRTSFMNFVREDDPFCFFFGFGVIYFPLAVVHQFMAACEAGVTVFTDLGEPKTLYPGPMRNGDTNDALFSFWHAQAFDMEPVPVHWDVRPVHLHYDVTSASEKAIQMRKEPR